MKILREENKYWNLYPNYEVYTSASNMCEQITLVLPSGREVQDQYILNCYCRSSVVKKNVFPLFYDHLKEVAFYSNANGDVLFIFKREKNTNRYLLLHVKFGFRMKKLRYVSEQLNYPPPKATSLTYLSKYLDEDGIRHAKALLLEGM